MGSASLTEIVWTVAAISGLLFHCVIVALSIGDWKSVPRSPAHAATLIVARANLRLFTGLAFVQLCWSLTGLTAIASVPGHQTSLQTVLIIGGLLLPSYVLPVLALLELLDRRKAEVKLRKRGE